MLKLLNADMDKFANNIKKQNRNIYFWGAGVLLQICMAYLLEKYDLYAQIVLCADSEKRKAGKKITIYGRSIPITTPEKLINLVGEDPKALIVISCSYFEGILSELDQIPELNDVPCYIVPFIYLENPILENKRPELGDIEYIPKKIHYCWFGNRINEKNRACIDSWKKYCPEYEIIEWNEINIGRCNSKWASYMLENKKWALLSDYIRAYVLYMYGGFYFDVDVTMYKNLDELRRLKAFISFEGWPVVNTGGGSGSVPSFWYWKETMELRDRIMNESKDIFYPYASGYYDTLPLMSKGLKVDGTLQTLHGITVLPSEYFHPFDYVSRILKITEKTYAVHHFNWSWADKMMKDGISGGVKNYQTIIQRMTENEKRKM